MAVVPAGGAGEEPFNSIVIERGAIRAIPYSVVEDSVKAGINLGKGATGSAKRIVVRGQQMIYKASSPGIVVNEYIAYQLYAVLGTRVPASYLVVNVPAGNIPMAVMTEYLSDAITVREALTKLKTGERTLLKLAIRSEFLNHALLLNWDAKNWENHMIVPDPSSDEYDINHPYTVDPGGALFYRAMGTPKRKSDLSMLEIQEFTNMPAESGKTHGRFFIDLVKPDILRSIVCRRAADIDDVIVMATVESLRPLYGFLPKDADLPGLIGGRLEYLRAFCAGKIVPGRVNLTARQAEILGLTDIVDTVEPLEHSIVRKRYSAKVGSMKDEAAEGLRMRGKRKIEPTNVLTNTNLASIQLHKLPVIKEHRHAGMNKYGFEYNSNTNSENENNDTEPPGLYPAHRYTIKQTASKKIRKSVLVAQEDPEIDAWLRKQVDFIYALSGREQDILKSYTRNGDVIVNNYLRGTLQDDSKDLIEASLTLPIDIDDRPIALGYSVLDQMSTLLQRKDLVVPPGYEKKEDYILESGDLNTFAMRAFMMNNLAYFGRAVNLGPLIEQYQRELTAILDKAPRAPRAFWVYRGIKSETHLTRLKFRTVDFLSTSMSPEWAAKLFTEKIEDENGMVSRTYRCCMYELKVNPSVPCLYIQSLSQYRDEYEMLIAPGMSVSLEPTVRLKMMIEPANRNLTRRNLKRNLRATTIAVVDGTVRKPAPRSTRKTSTRVEEEGSFEDIASRIVRTRTRTRRSTVERFASQKPRSQMKGRNRTRRFTINWKLTKKKRPLSNHSKTAGSKPRSSI